MDLKQAALLSLPSLLEGKKLSCWFSANFHGLQVRCHHCGAMLEKKALAAFLDFRITSCATCRRKTSFFNNTPLHAAKISREHFVVMAALLALNVPTKDIASALGLSDGTVREWGLKFDQLQGGAKDE